MASTAAMTGPNGFVRSSGRPQARSRPGYNACRSAQTFNDGSGPARPWPANTSSATPAARNKPTAQARPRSDWVNRVGTWWASSWPFRSSFHKTTSPSETCHCFTPRSASKPFTEYMPQLR
jgi:hypothetical protein